MASLITAGDTVFLGDREITITRVDNWTTPHRYHFIEEGKPFYCTRKDLTKKTKIMSKLKFKDYYKFPLKWNEDFSVRVFTQDHGMAFDFMMPMFIKSMYPNGSVLRKEDQRKIVDCINGDGSSFSDKTEVKYNPDNTTILAKDSEGVFREIIIVRGWGNLTGVGGHNLPQDQAIEVQNAFANYIVGKLNNTKSLSHD